MKAFEMVRPRDLKQAADALKTGDSMPLAGGTDLLGEMKEYLQTPTRLVNLKTIPKLNLIEDDGKGGLKVGALVKLADLADDARVKKSFAVLSQAISVTATPQLRNMATIGGNLCQRPRCWYYRDEHTLCLKKGGDKCYSVAGENQYHAILGGGPCHIVHPSDPAPALIALGASVVVTDGAKSKTIPAEQFFVLPSVNLYSETVLKPGELVTHVLIPAQPKSTVSAYVKEGELDSHDWTLASAAVAVTVAGGVVKTAKVVLGGVAQVPWRSKEAEAALIGKPATEATYKSAAKAALAKAVPMTHNAYKIPLAETVLARALKKAIG